jgi:hypothetical protein
MKTAAVAILLASLSLAQDQGEEQVHSNSYKGKAPPELEIDGKNWINARKAPKLADLKGRVVWLEFSFLN